MLKKGKLDPLCFKGFPMSVTKDGYLLPCCYCDDPDTLSDPHLKALYKKSKLEDYNSVQEILETPEWKTFANNLDKNKAPEICFSICGNKKPLKIAKRS